jgi:polyhydroxyalkanoate synthesis regulator phasin
MSTASAQDWFKGQQQYWDSWFDQQRKFFAGASPGAAPSFSGPQGQWAELLKVWQSAVSGTGQNAPDLGAFQQQFTKAGETYLNMMQQFYQGTGQAKTLEQMTKEWAESLQKFFGGAMAGGKDFSGFAKDPMSAVDPLNFFASFPGIGYSREKQEQLNHLYQQWSVFEAKFREYNNSMGKVGLEAVQKFQAYVANPPQGAEPLSSLKEVYAKWVDICEEIYAKYAMTEEYTTVYGDVVNALMSFKKQQNKMLDDAMDQLNLPTRAEVDSLHERLHALRREVAALKAELKPKAPKAKPEATTKQGKKS